MRSPPAVVSALNHGESCDEAAAYVGGLTRVVVRRSLHHPTDEFGRTLDQQRRSAARYHGGGIA